MDSAIDSIDVSGSLVKGTLLAAMIVALLLVLFLRRDALPEFRDFLIHGLKTGFGWIK